jgi:hypothetical protein
VLEDMYRHMENTNKGDLSDLHRAGKDDDDEDSSEIDEDEV